MTGLEFNQLIKICKERKIHISYSFYFGYINISFPKMPCATFYRDAIPFNVVIGFINADKEKNIQ